MRIGMIVGSVWATRKDERLSPCKLLIVQPLDLRSGREDGAPLVAVDIIGAGAGERVLVVQGSAACHAAGKSNPPVDATVVGIVDDTALAELKK
ncbi:MAG: EutN/CcmL family microcompartment protein [Oscillospiraceae bacterium]